jgi:amidohydrolase
MHACGHDGHTAVVTCALSAIADLHRRQRLPFRPRVRGIFQPEEETCLGACHMIDAGALEGVQGVLAAHVDPTRPVGRVGLRAGVLTAYCNHMQVVIQGRGGHAARPHEARDPICAAAQLIQWLYQQIPRATDSQDAVVITVGMVHGGHMANVIPERVELEGTVRTLNRSVRDDTLDHIRRLADAVAVGTQTLIEVNFGVGAQSVENDPELIDYLTDATRDVLGPDGVDVIARPSMGSEDFAFFSHRVPAAMFRLGCASERVGNAGLHTTLFDIDDEALMIGARIISRAVLSWLETRARSDVPEDSSLA